MRILLSLFTCLLLIQNISAQLRIEPLGSNSVLQKAAAMQQQKQGLENIRLAGKNDAAAVERNHDCDNIDGAFTDGETLYVDAGDSILICYNIEVYQAVTDESVSLDYGTSVFENSCLKYYASSTVELGLTDVIQISLCFDTLTNDCLEFSFPLVVKRADRQFVYPLQTLAQEQLLKVCIEPLDYQILGALDETVVRPCDIPLLGSVYNGVNADSCFTYTASRFAEMDSVCFEICDEYCVCDTYTYFFNTNEASAPFPFLDDFSKTGPYPDKTKWLDDNVYINTTMAFQPPTVGVATFDGLDKTGTPRYNGTSRSDFLTSSYFSFDQSDNDLWVSFWVENKGYSYPSNPGDSISLEFKNKNGDWVHQIGVDGENLLNIDLPPFEFFKIEVENTIIDTFLFDGFQLRFVNNGNSNSVQDTWHLDYVLLDDGEPDTTMNDMAFTKLPSDILEIYSSMPFWHFEGNEATELDDSIHLGISNLFPSVVGANTSNILHEDVMTGIDLGGQFVIQDPAINFDPNTKVDTSFSIPSIAFDELKASMENNFAGETFVEIERTYILDPNESETTSFEDILRNNQVSHTTVFDNYFAYDDGSAEAAVSLASVGPRAAVRYHANVADVLHGFSVHFSHYGDADTDNLFNIKVWIGSLNSIPVYEQDLLKPFFVDAVYDSLQGFTTYRFEDFDNVAIPIDIPAGDFYIGWQNASSFGPVRIGWDRNTPNAKDHQFYSANGSVWVSTADEGAYMIRAIVGQESPGVTKSEEA
ncbi:MAG: hypothetical protein ACI9XB_001911, partial [Gammaproteobacteria bacterium]